MVPLLYYPFCVKFVLISGKKLIIYYAYRYLSQRITYNYTYKILPYLGFTYVFNVKDRILTYNKKLVI